VFLKQPVEKGSPTLQRLRYCWASAQHNMHTARFRRCDRAKHWLPLYMFTGEATICDRSKAGWRNRIDENTRDHDNRENRTRDLGAWKVKELKQYYDRAEIPLRAYQDAGVAETMDSYVTEKDVQAPSDRRDAMSAAHEIDTQWGSTPYAYRDSHHNYGPDEYDY
jgi:hypothetical protein